jgi:hypothetical protein
LNNSIKADAKFLHRVFLGLVLLTTISGGMAAFTTVKAMNSANPADCIVFCK